MKSFHFKQATMLLCAVLAYTGLAQTQRRGGGGEAGLDGSGAVLVVPTVADPALKTEYDSPSVALMPKGKPRPELVVMLPGTGGKPAQYSALLRTLSDGGYHVIGLMYDNKPTEDKVCDKSGDLDCHRRFREERFAGDVPDAEVKNTPEEGIEHRLVMMLRYLAKQSPRDGWNQYLDGDHPAWAKIAIAGHSQGSGHAAYIAKTHEVARAVLFSGPYDGIDLRGTPKLSTWLSDPTKTPMDRWYAEYHEHDLGEPIIPLTLAAIKVPPDQIIVSRLPSTSGAAISYHMMGSHDERMLPQWKWLFGIPGGTK
jgi:dienelactone hydrolase